MGDVRSAIAEVERLIQQLTESVKRRKYFELGDDPVALNEIEAGFSEIYARLGELDPLFTSKSMKEKNPYYAATSASNLAGRFLEMVRDRRGGSPENTAQFLRYLDSLRLAVIRLADGKSQIEDQVDTTAQPEKMHESQPKVGESRITTIQRQTPSYNGQVFVSYAWGGQREEIVNQIDKSLQQRGITIIRDKRDLQYKGSIKEFMQRIGKSDCVIVVISDKYLRSPNCMYELVEISKNRYFYDRIFPIILTDADIYKTVNQLAYIKHWENEINQLKVWIKEVDPTNLQGIYQQLDLYDEIRDNISKLIGILSDMNALTPEMHQDSDFSELYYAIEKRVQALQHFH